MSEPLKITGKIEPKRYRCEQCGHELMSNTNHYGEFYDRCPNCSWKSPMHPIRTFVCLEPLPKGWATPPRWKKVTLGKVA